MFEISNLHQKPNLELLQNQKKISKTEKRYLDGLENELGLKINRQVLFPSGQGWNYTLDGVIEDSQVVIEYDGAENHESEIKQHKDNKRDLILLKNGFSVYRFQWFGLVPRSEYQTALNQAIKDSSREIKILLKLKSL